MEGGEKRGRIVRQSKTRRTVVVTPGARPRTCSASASPAGLTESGAGGDPRVRGLIDLLDAATARDARKSRTCGQS